ncbi:MAG: prepilin-type N-terminal cleavage/methylation domain-containing protein [Gallionella sp.]
MTKSSGFTLIELGIVVAILAVLAAIVIPMYGDYKDRINVQKAISDIVEIGSFIKQYENDNRELPDSLADAGVGGKVDPWGHAYEYLNITTQKGKGSLRKDKSLNPLNSDYDLYSKGKDGVTKMQISQKDSLDDVIRIRDGQFIGLAADF